MVGTRDKFLPYRNGYRKLTKRDARLGFTYSPTESYKEIEGRQRFYLLKQNKAKGDNVLEKQSRKDY